VDDGALPGDGVSAVRRIVRAVAARPGTAAIIAVGIAWGVVVHTAGWAQLAHFSQVRAFADGQAEIDRWHWETGDKAWIDGHFYSVKSPGVAALTTPAYLAIEEAGGLELSREAAANAGRSSDPRWVPNDRYPYPSYGFDYDRAQRVQQRVEDNTLVLWMLTLIAAVVPSVALLFGVRRLADRLEPGYGTAAAITLGLATLLFIFAAEFFSHAISTALGFAAFMVLVAERRRAPSLALVAAAGLLAGIGVSFEFQVGLVGVVLFFYAALRAAVPRVRRAGAFAVAAVGGAIPALAFNAWALGSPLRLAYSDAVAVIGRSGHAALGLNDDGFFGISAPNLDSAVELLLGGRGVLVLTPVLAVAAIGVVLMWRRGYRGEAGVVAATVGAYLLYNAGYWQPFGGGTPGPRFLVPILPFLALGLAFTYRRLPALTLALAIPSGFWMILAGFTYPLIGEQGTGLWIDMLNDGTLEHTLLTVVGVHNSWVALLPVLVAIAAAIGFAATATPPTRIGDIRPALAALGGWAVIATVGPTIAGEPVEPLDGGPSALYGVAIATIASASTLIVLRYRERRGERARSEPITSELALGEPIS
jgi:hypothetical protein